MAVPKRYLSAYNKNSQKKTRENGGADGEPEAKAAADLRTDGGEFFKTIQTNNERSLPPPEQSAAYRKVAKFLLLIGADEAAQIMSRLSDEQAELVAREIASIRRVDADEAAAVLAEFSALAQKAKQESGGAETAREILQKAFGRERGDEILNKAVPDAADKPFSCLTEIDSERLRFILKDESPAVRSLVLSQISPKMAASVIKALSPEEKAETLRRLAKMEKVDKETLRRVDCAIREKLKNVDTSDKQSVDGAASLVSILRHMDAASEDKVLRGMLAADPELTESIKNRLFTLDDVARSGGLWLQNELRSMSDADIAALISGESAEIRAGLFAALSKTRGARVLEEESLSNPIPQKEKTRVKTEFLNRARAAWERGLIIIDAGDDTT